MQTANGKHAMNSPVPTVSAPSERVQRHAAMDRAFHWITAVAVLVLLATSFLPIVGVRFPWVTLHWVAGVVLTAAVLFHIVRALFWLRLRCMWISVRDIKEAAAGIQRTKYSLAQKLMHHALSLMALVAVVTGIPMLAKVETPFWERNPYLLSAETWGVIYVLHGLAALVAVTLVMIHVYFGLIAENRPYLRAMIRGWMTQEEWAERNEVARASRTEPAKT
jgi:formate dehydrogenase subunit gamma